MTSKTSTIPSVDLSPFFVDEGVVIGEDPTEEQLDCANQIDQVCRHHGFIHVTNFGVNPELYERAFKASNELFAIPVEEKLSTLTEWKPNFDVGYSKYRRESTNISRPPELKEAYSVRFPPTHTNKFQGCPESFEQVAKELLPVMEHATHRYCLACSLALNLPFDFFDKTFTKMDMCTLRFLHYPPCDLDATGISTDKPLRIGEHADFGAFTYLLLPPGQGAEGLQIKPVEGGEAGGIAGGEGEGWVDVVIPSGGAIINTGTLMARWTNDEWKATAHRVVVPSQLEAGRDRYSIAFFADPDQDSMVEVHDSFVGENKPQKYEPISGLDYILMKLEELAKPGQESSEQ